MLQHAKQVRGGGTEVRTFSERRHWEWSCVLADAKQDKALQDSARRDDKCDRRALSSFQRISAVGPFVGLSRSLLPLTAQPPSCLVIKIHWFALGAGPVARPHGSCAFNFSARSCDSPLVSFVHRVVHSIILIPF